MAQERGGREEIEGLTNIIGKVCGDLHTMEGVPLLIGSHNLLLPSLFSCIGLLELEHLTMGLWVQCWGYQVKVTKEGEACSYVRMHEGADLRE